MCSTKDKVVGSRDLEFVIEGLIGGGDVVDDGVRRIELVIIGGGGPIVVIVAVPVVLMPVVVVIPFIVMPIIVIGFGMQCGDTCLRRNVIVDEDSRLVLSVDNLDAAPSRALPWSMAGALFSASDAWSSVVPIARLALAGNVRATSEVIGMARL